MRQWLLFIATELHKAVFVPLLEAVAGPEVKAYALAKAPLRLGWVEARLADREFLLDHFTVTCASSRAMRNPVRHATRRSMPTRPADVRRAFVLELGERSAGVTRHDGSAR